MIGKRIKYLRDERHLSQEKLAAALGVSRMTVNNMRMKSVHLTLILPDILLIISG